MASRRPRLSSDELRQVRWLLGGVLMLVAVPTAFTLDLGAGWAAGLAAAAILAALVFPALPARVPVWGHRLAFPVIVAFFAGDLWMNGEILPAMVRLDLLLLLYRGICYRQKRDDLQIVVLGLFLIVVAGVLTVSVAFAGEILLFTGCALGLLLVITLMDASAGKAAAPMAPQAGPPAWAASVRWPQLLRRLREVSDWRLLGLGAFLFVAVMTISGLLFLAIPRFQIESSLFLERFVTRKAKTGFNDTIKFGDVTDIAQDDGIALNVDLSSPAQAPAVPYWRMLVLDEYQGGTFRLSPAMRLAAFARERTEATLRGGLRAPGAPTWTFYLESGVSRYLPLLGRFETLRFREVQYVRTAADLGVVALRDEPAAMTAYRVEGMPPGNGEVKDPAFAARWRHRTAPTGLPLQLHVNVSPADRTVLERVLQEAGGGAGLAPLFAARASAWLRQRHAYTLAPRIPAGAGDPLVRWMDSSAAGHCELFAGAFVLLARTAGFPARVITGFKGGTWNGYSNNFTVRNSDAHAWAEIWNAETGAWLRADPLEVAGAATGTQADAAGAAARPADRSWSARLESLRVFWYRRIVDFDQRSQIDTLRAVKNATEDSSRRVRAALENAVARAKAWLAQPWGLRRGALAAGTAAIAALLVWAWRRRVRAVRTPGWAGRPDPIRRTAGWWLARLEPGAEPVADLQRLRFGQRESWPEPASVFRRARRAARAGRVDRPR